MQKQYEPHGIESRWYERWEEAGLFAPDPEAQGDPFVITLPPPNVTGILHIGHCLGGVIMDALVRYYRMRGRPTLFVPGTDHASIATENKVAAQIAREGGDKRGLGREKFLERAWDWSNHHHDRIVSQFRRYGVSLDWSREAFTMDEPRNRAVLTAFKRLYDDGLIYRGDYMVNWSVAQQSAVSDEEVVYKEVQGKLWHIRYPLVGGGHLTVATTRPETMLGDTAVAIHPGEAKTAHLLGKEVELPLTGRVIPVIEDAHVDPEFGSGCVKVTPAHDPNDYEIGKRHDLQFLNILLPDGRLNDNVPEAYRGLDRFAARKQVVADLESAGLLEKVEEHTHNVGFHDRTDTVIEPYISRQWFLKMESLAKPAIAAVEDGTIKMFPERWIGVYYHWMRNIKDWCISRQLWWGHRIPYYECSECQHVMVEVDTPSHCTECGSAKLVQDDDVLDTWFSSWLWTFSPLGWPDEAAPDLKKFHPTSVLVTAADIIFFWVARMIMASEHFLKEPPFTEVIYTGLVRDAQGRKLSKSLGNSPDPMDLMDQYGADALRFVLVWLTPTGQDINFGNETVEQGRNFCNKLWNATRLLFSNLEGVDLEFQKADRAAMASELSAFDADAEPSFARFYRELFGADLPDQERAALTLEDRWMLHRLFVAMRECEKAMESRRLNDAAHAAYACFWNEYCDWYLEAIKVRLHGDDVAAKRTALLVALAVHGALLRMLHPFVPFISEELWSQHPQGAGFCMGAPMPRSLAQAPFAEDARRFALAQELVQAARNLRNEMGVAPGKRGSLLLQAADGRVADLEAIRAQVELLAKMESVELLAGEPPSQAARTVVGDVQVHLPMAGLIDLDKERTRLSKERDAVQKHLEGLRGKLGNENFLSRAPAEVVERERLRAAELAETVRQLEEQIEALG